MTIPFFKNIEEVKQFVPGIDSKEKLTDFQPYAITAQMEISKIIGSPLWDEMLETYNRQETAKGLQNLRGAVAFFIAIEHALYDTIKRNNTERKVYKYQYNEIVSTLTEKAHFYMSALLQDIADNTLFQQTTTAEEQKKLLVKNFQDFGNIYNIDNSAYFFHLSVFLQKEAIRNHIQSRNINLQNTKVQEYAKIAIVYHTMALAVERLDTMVLPKILRKDLELNSEFIKRGEESDTAKSKLAHALKIQGDKALLNLDNEMSKQNKNYKTSENISKEDDKFFMPC